MSDGPDLICAVCHAEPAVGVAAVPGVPMSVAYGADCLRANAHPYHVVVANTAMCDGLENCADWWREIVDDTLRHLHIAYDVFTVDVADAMREMREDMPSTPIDTVLIEGDLL